MSVKALVFDAYGTLFSVQSLSDLCGQLYPGKGAALSASWRAKQLEYTWLLSLMRQYQDFWAVTRMALRYSSAGLGLSSSEASEERLMQAYLTLPTFPEVRPALERLSSQYTLALLSNGSPDMLDTVVRVNNLDPYFTHILSADEVGVYKPDPKVYALATRALGLEPAEMAFISANGWDSAGAKLFGFRVAWCNRPGLPLETHAQEPDWVIGSLDQLEAVLLEGYP